MPFKRRGRFGKARARILMPLAVGRGFGALVAEHAFHFGGLRAAVPWRPNTMYSALMISR